MYRRILIILFFIVAMPLGACDDGYPRVGSGPISISSSAGVAIQEYLQHACPMVLAIDSKGWGTSRAFGPEEGCDDFQSFSKEDQIKRVTGLLKTCDNSVNSPPCSVFAVGSKIVWKGDIKFKRGKWTPSRPNQNSVILKAQSKDSAERNIFNKAIGLATFNASGTHAKMKFSYSSSFGRCKGGMIIGSTLTGSFTVSCTKAGTASGEVELNSDRRSGVGAGSGPNRRHFEIIILAREPN